MASKYKLTINDTDEVLINVIPEQPEDGYDEGTVVTINVKYGPNGNLFGSINGAEVVIDKAVFEVTMDSAKTVTIKKEGDESEEPSAPVTPITPPPVEPETPSGGDEDGDNDEPTDEGDN